MAANTTGSWGGLLDWPLIGIHAILTGDGKVLSFGSDGMGHQGGFMYDVMGSADEQACDARQHDAHRHLLLGGDPDSGNGPDHHHWRRRAAAGLGQYGRCRRQHLRLLRRHPHGGQGRRHELPALVSDHHQSHQRAGRRSGRHGLLRARRGHAQRSTTPGWDGGRCPAPPMPISHRPRSTPVSSCAATARSSISPGRRQQWPL